MEEVQIAIGKEPTNDDLWFVAKSEAVNDWQRVCHSLGVNGDIIELAEQTHSRNTRGAASARFNYALTEWMDELSANCENNPTAVKYEDICKALEDSGYASISEELKKRALTASETKYIGAGLRPENAFPTPSRKTKLSNKAKSSRRCNSVASAKSGAMRRIQFVLLTTNDREEEVVHHFLGDSEVGESLGLRVSSYTHKQDPILSFLNVTLVKNVTSGSLTFDLVTIGGVQCIHLRCCESEADSTIRQVLSQAKEEDWPLDTIFSIGCCDCSTSELETNYRGSVILAPQIIDCDTNVVTEKENQPYTYCMSADWSERIKAASSCGEHSIPITISDGIFSGEWIAKNGMKAAKLRGSKNTIGIEQGSVRIAKVLQEEEILSSVAAAVNLLVVKGVSDYAGADKRDKAKIKWFGKGTRNPVSSECRQAIATLQSTAVVCRAIAAAQISQALCI